VAENRPILAISRGLGLTNHGPCDTVEPLGKETTGGEGRKRTTRPAGSSKSTQQI